MRKRKQGRRVAARHTSGAVATAPRRDDYAGYAPLNASPAMRLRAAAQDVGEGFRRHRVWRYMAMNQVRNMYRRTMLGPWWITLQTGVYVAGITLVFGQLQGINLREFVPYVALGFLAFQMMVRMISAATTVFVTQSGVILSSRQPLSVLVLREVAVDVVQFGHNILILVPFFAFGIIGFSPWLALAPLALLVIIINGIALALWLGVVAARFRDIGPAVESVLRVLIFFTPVFYRTRDLGSAEFLVNGNPVTHLVVLLRTFILGVEPQTVTLVGVAITTAVNLVLAIVVFSHSRSRLPYWVT